MLDQLVFRVERIPSLLAGLALLGLALWLLWFDFETRLHRAFALLLVLKAFLVGLLAFGRFSDDLALVVRFYFAIGIPFAAAYCALLFRAHFATPRRNPPGWLWAVGLTVVAGLFVALYLLRRDLYRAPDGAAGPLQLFLPLAYGAFAIIALVLVRAALRESPGRRRRALLLVALALSIEPLYQALFQVLSVPASATLGVYEPAALLQQPLLLIEKLAWLAAVAIVALAAMHLLSERSRSDPELRRDSLRMLFVMLLPVATALVSLGALVSDRLLGSRIFIDLHLALDALWIVVGAAILVYAIVNHHFLDARPRVRRAVRTSTLVGALLIVFFIAQELLEEVLQDTYQFLPSLGAALIAVVLLQPILAVVTRFVRAALPAPELSSLPKAERIAVYRSQVELVWMDGVVSRKERSLLDRMRERLDLNPDAAHRIELEIMGAEAAASDGDPGARPRRRAGARS